MERGSRDPRNGTDPSAGIVVDSLVEGRARRTGSCRSRNSWVDPQRWIVTRRVFQLNGVHGTLSNSLNQPWIPFLSSFRRFQQTAELVATSHEYTYVRRRSTLECWFSRGVHVEGTIFNFFESNPNVSSSVCSTMIEKRAQGSLFVYGELCEKVSLIIY